MLYLIGLGLGDASDITVKGLEIVRRVKTVYLEAYTSVLTVEKDELEKLYGREVIVADRDLVEQRASEIIQAAEHEDVAFLVVGDPFGATTHADLVLRAKEAGVPYRVIHNASIITAVGCCGLQLYSFGETVSIPFWTDTWRPSSFYDKIAANRSLHLHTLCLLDIKMKEQSLENLMKGRKIFEPPRFMTVKQASEQLVQILQDRRAGGLELAFTEENFCVGLARVGCETQKIVSCPLEDMQSVDLGGPLHSLIIMGHAHPLEMDFVKMFALDIEKFQKLKERGS